MNNNRRVASILETGIWISLVALSASALWFLVTAYPRIQTVLYSLTGNQQYSCGCDTTFSLSTNPFGYGSTLFIAVISLYFVVSLLIHFGYILYKTNGHIASLSIVQIDTHDSTPYSIVRVANSVGAFSHKKTIYIEEALYSTLNAQERESIIAHESAHIRRRDDLRMGLLSSIRKTFFFIPFIQTIITHIELAIEIQADCTAANRVSTQNMLLALRSSILHSSQQHIHGTAIAPFSVTQERLRILLGHSSVLKQSYLLIAITITVLITSVTTVYAADDNFFDSFNTQTAPTAAACIEQIQMSRGTYTTSATTTQSEQNSCEAIESSIMDIEQMSMQ